MLKLYRKYAVYVNSKIPTWAGCQVLTSQPQSPQISTAFSTFISKSLTKPSTVYTALKSVQCILAQLDQDIIPVFCDEGVFSHCS